MPKNKRSGSSEFGPLSHEVMEAVWKAGRPVSVREIADALNSRRSEPLAYTTVMTVMVRLAEKETLTRERRGRGFVYTPTASDSAGIAVKSVIRAYGDSAMAHFVEEARADPDALERLRGLLREK
jgi:predicted transcriptional regulator